MTRAPSPAEDAAPDLEAIRAAAAERVRETTLRFAAREVGITPMSLKKFIALEVLPYGRTMDRLRAWYRRDLLARRQALGPDEAATVVELLLAEVPAAERPKVAAALLDYLGRLFEDHGTTPPPWHAALRQSYRAGGPPRPPGAGGPRQSGGAGSGAAGL